MFEEVTSKFIEEKDKLIDYCTRKLIEYAGVRVPEKLNAIDILMLVDDLKQKGYKLNWYNDCLVLVQLGDFCEDKICGYEFSVKSKDDYVIFAAEPLEF